MAAGGRRRFAALSMLFAVSIVLGGTLLIDRGAKPSGSSSADLGDAAARAIAARRPVALRSFHYLARLNSIDKLPEPVKYPTQMVEVWFQAPNKRKTIYYQDATDEINWISVSDGQFVWMYSFVSNQYSRYELQKLPQGWRLGMPILGPTDGLSVMDWVEKQPDGPPTWQISRVELDKEAGRRILVQETCCHSGRFYQAIGSRRYSFDWRYGFLLRFEDESVTHLTSLEVTEFDFNQTVDSRRFVFQPPAGATEMFGATPATPEP